MNSRHGVSIVTIDLYIRRFRQAYISGDYEVAAKCLLTAHACIPTTNKQQKVKSVE